jgi:hypothetical protein
MTNPSSTETPLSSPELLWVTPKKVQCIA